MVSGVSVLSAWDSGVGGGSSVFFFRVLLGLVGASAEAVVSTGAGALGLRPRFLGGAFSAS